MLKGTLRADSPSVQGVRVCVCVCVRASVRVLTPPNAGLSLVAPVDEADGAESCVRRMEEVKVQQPSAGTAPREGCSSPVLL